VFGAFGGERESGLVCFEHSMERGEAGLVCLEHLVERGGIWAGVFRAISQNDSISIQT